MDALTGELAAIREDADQSFPVDVLDGAQSALLLFGAGFLGKQDGIWVADRGIPAVCVDYRDELLAEMARVYPDDWAFLQGDVYDLVHRNELQPADVVCVDCPSGHFQICADLSAKWCALARHAVVLGTGRQTEVFPPRGWTQRERIHRSSFAGGTQWAVLTPEATE